MTDFLEKNVIKKVLGIRGKSPHKSKCPFDTTPLEYRLINLVGSPVSRYRIRCSQNQLIYALFSEVTVATPSGFDARNAELMPPRTPLMFTRLKLLIT